LAAVAALAEFPNRIKKVFASNYTSSGLTAFNVYVRGVPSVVAVDDYLPFRANNLTLYASRASDNGLWVPLLEKALAKISGNYE
jgi:calpain-15